VAGWAHAKGERLPPIVKARMLDADCESCLLDLAQPGGVEQPRKGALASTGKLRLILDLGIEFARRIPEQAERPLTTSVIPHACRHDTAWANHAHHFTQPLCGICHEVNDELRESSVECLVRERQLLCRAKSHVDAWVTVPGRSDKRLGRINSRNEVRSQPPYQLGRKRTWTTADIEHSLTSRDPREIGQLRGDQHRVPAHEAVVRISRSEEVHQANLALAAATATLLLRSSELDNYGRGGIRTPEAGVTRLLVFKTSAFNRSATLPNAANGKASRSAGRQREVSGDHPTWIGTVGICG
jgi:hypothetical protein